MSVELPLGEVLAIGLIAFAISIGVLLPAYRNARFLGFVAVVGAVLVGATSLAPRARDAVELVAVGAVTVGIVFAERVGLGSMTNEEYRLDRELERARRLAASEGGSRSEAVAILDQQLASPSVDAQWRAGLRLLRCAWSPTGDGAVRRFVSSTPKSAFEIVAWRHLGDVRMRRTLGAARRIGPLEESILLRAYLDEVRRLLPPGVIGPDGLLPAEGMQDARKAIDELRQIDLVDVDARSVRDSLVGLLDDEVAMHVTGPTAADNARYDQRSAALDEAWRQLDARAAVQSDW